MKPQATRIRAVFYDARAQMFLAEVSFLDQRGQEQRRRVATPGKPDQSPRRILSSLVAAACGAGKPPHSPSEGVVR